MRKTIPAITIAALLIAGATCAAAQTAHVSIEGGLACMTGKTVAETNGVKLGDNGCGGRGAIESLSASSVGRGTIWAGTNNGLIHVSRDGRIDGVSLKGSSGNKLMDESAMAAARRVLRLDRPPESLVSGSYAEISVNFQLEG